MMKDETIGFVGLGNMGFHMANRLAKAGYSLAVFDVDNKWKNYFEELGVRWVSSLVELANTASVIGVSLPTPQIVEAVLCGSESISEGNKVEVVFDTSTTGPEVIRRAAAALARKDIVLIDAPVSGGTTGAENGTLSVMASGNKEAFDKVRPLLTVIGRSVFYLGDSVGQGQTMKIINNTMCAVSTLASFEGLVLGVKAGLDPKMMLDIVNVSSGRCFATEVKIPECILERNFPLKFTTDLLFKDVKLCLDEADRQGLPMWVSDSARQMLAFSIGQGDGKMDYGNLIKRYEEWAGVQFGNVV